jgi:hypothetical protein
MFRPLVQGVKGPDVEGAKRVVYKQLAAHDGGKWWTYFEKMRPRVRRKFGPRFKNHVKKIQAQLGVEQDGVFGQRTLNACYEKDRVDDVAEALFKQARPSHADLAFTAMFAEMKKMSDHTPGYLLGGGHGIPIRNISAYQKLDCSSSTSRALFAGGMWKYAAALVSGEIARVWGEPGTGQRFTVYANGEHVWIRLYTGKWWKGGYWRFDTSPHGDGGRGPKLRRLPRLTWGFTAKHWEGM